MVVAVTAVEVLGLVMNNIQIVLGLGLSHEVSHAYLRIDIQHSI